MTEKMIGNLLRAWTLSSRLNARNVPATASAVARAEAVVGRPIPEELIAVYQYSNGGAFLEGNLMLDPIEGQERSLASNGDWLRACGWPIPRELLVFGSNGCGDQFGL